MEDQKKNSQPDEEISDEVLEQVSGGSKAAFESTENSTVDEQPEETAGEKGNLFKFKKKTFLRHHEE